MVTLEYRNLGITCPFESKPRISFPTDDVLPVSISCLWRNNFCLAWPRPLSKQLCVSTPNNVDFPASTLPTTAILTSQKSASASNRLRIKKSLVSFPPSSSFVRRRVNEQSNFEATFSNEATTLSQSSADKPKISNIYPIKIRFFVINSLRLTITIFAFWSSPNLNHGFASAI